MNIETTEHIIWIVVGVLATIQLLYTFIVYNAVHRRTIAEKKGKTLVTDKQPGISVVIATADCEELLAKHLPLILEQDYPDFEVIVDWYPTENTWILWSQYIGTYTSDGYGDFDLYFVPAKYVEAGQEVYASDGLPICIGCDMPGGERAVIGYAEEGESLYTHMRFAGIWADGIGGITATTDFPTFPITVTPAASTQSTDSTAKLVRRKATR